MPTIANFTKNRGFHEKNADFAKKTRISRKKRELNGKGANFAEKA